MTDSDHVRALADTEARRGALLNSSAGAASWWRILAAIALLIGIPLAIYLFTKPAVYVGDVRWGPRYATITLVGSGKTLAVTDSTEVTINGSDFSLDAMQTRLFPPQGTAAFPATVAYKSYSRPKGVPLVAGEAMSIETR